MARTPKDLRPLEARLRAERPTPSASLMRSLTPRRSAPLGKRLALTSALTAVMLVALASVGGASYAANALAHAAKTAVKVVRPAAHASARVPSGVSAGGDQYRPGYGFGDPDHNHVGPPGLTKGNKGSKTPPVQTKPNGKGIMVTSSISSDEQAALYFSVLGPNGEELLLTQQGSQIGSGLEGPQTKSIHYVMLVPRTLPFSIRVPANLLVPGKTYTIRVIAVDAQGNKSTVLIPFTA